MRGWRIASLMGLVALPTACAQADRETPPAAPHALGADFGNAVSHNAAQQIIDPLPPAANAGAPPLAGDRARLTMERYERGSVLAPEQIETTTFGDSR